jgi:hypothetical protein
MRMVGTHTIFEIRSPQSSSGSPAPTGSYPNHNCILAWGGCGVITYTLEAGEYVLYKYFCRFRIYFVTCHMLTKISQPQTQIFSANPKKSQHKNKILKANNLCNTNHHKNTPLLDFIRVFYYYYCCWFLKILHNC